MLFVMNVGDACASMTRECFHRRSTAPAAGAEHRLRSCHEFGGIVPQSSEFSVATRSATALRTLPTLVAFSAKPPLLPSPTDQSLMRSGVPPLRLATRLMRSRSRRLASARRRDIAATSASRPCHGRGTLALAAATTSAATARAATSAATRAAARPPPGPRRRPPRQPVRLRRR